MGWILGLIGLAVMVGGLIGRPPDDKALPVYRPSTKIKKSPK